MMIAHNIHYRGHSQASGATAKSYCRNNLYMMAEICWLCSWLHNSKVWLSGCAVRSIDDTLQNHENRGINRNLATNPRLTPICNARCRSSREWAYSPTDKVMRGSNVVMVTCGTKDGIPAISKCGRSFHLDDQVSRSVTGLSMWLLHIVDTKCGFSRFLVLVDMPRIERCLVAKSLCRISKSLEVVSHQTKGKSPTSHSFKIMSSTFKSLLCLQALTYGHYPWTEENALQIVLLVDWFSINIYFDKEIKNLKQATRRLH